MPEDFGISDGIRKWAEDKGHRNLEAHLEYFVDWVKSKGKTYVNWDSAFKNAVRQNWAKLNGNHNETTHRVHKPGSSSHHREMYREIAQEIADREQEDNQALRGTQEGLWEPVDTDERRH